MQKGVFKIHFDRSRNVQQVKAEAVQMLRDQGELTDADTFTVEDLTNAALRAEGRRMIVVRVSSP